MFVREQFVEAVRFVVGWSLAAVGLGVLGYVWMAS
jgi:hypothetical protein